MEWGGGEPSGVLMHIMHSAAVSVSLCCIVQLCLSAVSVSCVCQLCLSAVSVSCVCQQCLSAVSVSCACQQCLSAVSVSCVCQLCLSACLPKSGLTCLSLAPVRKGLRVHSEREAATFQKYRGSKCRHLIQGPPNEYFLMKSDIWV